MISLVTTLLLATPAFAQDQSTAMTSQQEATFLLQQQERIAALEARARKAEAAVKKAEEAKPAPAPQQTVVVEPIEPPAPKADPELEALKGELEAAKRELEAAKRAYDTATAGMAAMRPPVVNVTVQPAAVELHPVVLRTETTNVRTSGFHPNVYVLPTALIGKPLPGSDDAIGVRLDIGTRLVWDVSENTALGLSVEGGPGMGGWSVRAMPTLVGYNARDTGWGVMVGAGYNCDGLTDAGCMAERTGGLAAGTWEHGWGVFNFNARLGGEVNYVTTPDASGAEFRVFTGVGVAFGVARPNTVTIPE